MRNLVYLVSGILLVSTSTACVSQSARQLDVVSNPTTPATNAVDSTANQTSNPSTKPKSRPSKKTVTDEWTQKQIPVKLFGAEGLPFTTYFPESDFIVESAAADEGMGVWFYSKVGGKKKESAYVHFFFPAKPTTLEGMRRAVTGKRGLMETNKWTVKSRTQDVPYRWARERIDFEQPKGNTSIMGTVYIGEYKGKAFQVTEHFPADYGDGFAPRASIILKELQVKD
jgi:hypothetical protein